MVDEKEKKQLMDAVHRAVKMAREYQKKARLKKKAHLTDKDLWDTNQYLQELENRRMSKDMEFDNNLMKLRKKFNKMIGQKSSYYWKKHKE